MSQRIVRVDQVEKSFAEVKAVDGISFEVRPGEVFALLGPNGAGKSTLVRMLVGILRPDAGEIVYGLGAPAGGFPASGELGYLPEDRGLYRDMPVARTLAYFGILRGMDRRAAEKAAGTWLERLGLADRAADKLETLSKGNQQKVQLAAAILHRPRFALLDEPFSGLDPLNQQLLLDLLRELCDEGMTVLLSAHQMELIERVADRVLLIGHGREVLSGPIREVLRGAAAGRRISIVVEGEGDLSVLADHSAVAEIGASTDGACSVLLHDGASLGELIAAVERRHRVLEVRSERETLHDVYVRALGGTSAGTPKEESA